MLPFTAFMLILITTILSAICIGVGINISRDPLARESGQLRAAGDLLTAFGLFFLIAIAVVILVAVGNNPQCVGCVGS